MSFLEYNHNNNYSYFVFPKHIIFGKEDKETNLSSFIKVSLVNDNDKPLILERQEEKANDISCIPFVIFSKEYYDYCEIYKIKPFDLFPHKKETKYKRAYNEVLDKNNNNLFPPWHLIIPKQDFNQELKTFISDLREHISIDLLISENFDSFLNYYHSTYQKHTVLFESLKPVKIASGSYLKAITSQETTNKHILTGFAPNSSQNGFTKDSVKYERNHTQTGRLIVKENSMDILTLSKNLRNSIFESRFGDNNGSIYYLDFKSLEPRVLLHLTTTIHVSTKVPLANIDNNNLVQDIYNDILDKMNLKNVVTREIIKPIIIMILYGASEDLILKHLKEKENIADKKLAKKLYDFVYHDYFKVDLIKNKFCNNIQESKTKHNRRHYIYSYYGRPIFIDENINNNTQYKLLNYFIQSTAVDVALFGFTNIINKINEMQHVLDNKIVPLFILHDALILDVHKDCEQTVIHKLASYGGKKGNIPKFEDFEFPIEVTKMNINSKQ